MWKSSKTVIIQIKKFLFSFHTDKTGTTLVFSYKKIYKENCGYYFQLPTDLENLVVFTN